MAFRPEGDKVMSIWRVHCHLFHMDPPSRRQPRDYGLMRPCTDPFPYSSACATRGRSDATTSFPSSP